MTDDEFERIKQGLSPVIGGRAKRALDALRALESEVGTPDWLTKAIDECHALVYDPTAVARAETPESINTTGS